MYFPNPIIDNVIIQWTLSRKVGTNQVRAIRILLSGSAEDMERIEKQGKLNDWCKDNLDWVRKTFGADNLVSAVLHMDEMKPIGFKGKLYSSEYQRHFETELSEALVKQHPIDMNSLQLTIDGVSDVNWFRQKYREFQESIGINITDREDRNRGIRR